MKLTIHKKGIYATFSPSTNQSFTTLQESPDRLMFQDPSSHEQQSCYPGGRAPLTTEETWSKSKQTEALAWLGSGPSLARCIPLSARTCRSYRWQSHMSFLDVALLGVAGLGLCLLIAGPPRPVGIRLTSVLAIALPATGVTFHSASVSVIAGIGMLLVALFPGVSRSRRPKSFGHWAIPGALTIVLGGVLTFLVSASASSLPLIQFGAGSLPVGVGIVRLAPSEGEAKRILRGLLVGIFLSCMAGFVIKEPSSPRALGLAFHPNQLAMTAVIGLPLLWYLRRGWLWILPALILVAGVLQSGSRSGVLALGVVLVSWVYRSFGLLRSAILALGLGAATMLIGLPALDTPATNRLFGDPSTLQSDISRLGVMQDEWARITHNYVFGGGFSDVIEPHNIILWVWGGTGIVGFAALLFVTFRASRGWVDRRVPTEQWALSTAFVGFLVAVALNNALGAPFAWLIIGLGDARFKIRRATLLRLGLFQYTPASRAASRSVRAAPSAQLRQ
jgi:hypothetical protein